MHIMIKDNYLNLDDVLVVSEIRNAGGDGAQLFYIMLKNCSKVEFLYHRSHEYEVLFLGGDFHFGSAKLFLSAYTEIIKKLTDAA